MTYSPLWQVNLVSFNFGRQGRVLNSQSAILGAAAAGEVTITRPGIIVECSVIFTPGVGCFREPGSQGAAQKRSDRSAEHLNKLESEPQGSDSNRVFLQLRSGNCIAVPLSLSSCIGGCFFTCHFAG